MGRIKLETYIAAPLERCFDLARNVDLHVATAATTGEEIVPDSSGRVPRGLLQLGETVTFRGRHFGITQQVTARITKLDRPHSFRDSQVAGIFARFDHDHIFETQDGGTVMTDVFDFECPLGPFGRIADPIVARHLSNFIRERNLILKEVAESEKFKIYLSETT